MRAFVIGPELQFIDLALFLPQTQTLVIADLHLGIEEALCREGVFVPRGHFARVQQRLERILQALHVSAQNPLARLVINGDLRHQFGPLSQAESQETQQLLSWLSSQTEDIILVSGNHDGDLAHLAQRFPQCTVTSAHREAHCWIVHGDEIIAAPKEIEWTVIGHEHPAVSLRDPITARTEVYKSFLVCKEQKLIVLPSFNQLIRGSDLTKEAPLSPYLNNLQNFSVYPVSDTGAIYSFGPLRRLLI
jgi:putative SbcD/Mre11-related phosphoesterase